MATIVRSRKTKRKYVVLGAGFGLFRAATGSPMFGNWRPTEESGFEELLAVCNARGEAGFLPIAEMEVVSVDGQSPKRLLAETAS